MMLKKAIDRLTVLAGIPVRAIILDEFDMLNLAKGTTGLPLPKSGFGGSDFQQIRRFNPRGYTRIEILLGIPLTLWTQKAFENWYYTGGAINDSRRKESKGGARVFTLPTSWIRPARPPSVSCHRPETRRSALTLRLFQC